MIEKVATSGGIPKIDEVEAELVLLMEATAPRLKSLKVQIALFGFDDGGGRLFQLNTYETKLNKGQPLSTTRREPVANDFLFFGEHAAALDTAKRVGVHPSSDPLVVVRELIGIQIRATPDRVGPPINVLRIDSVGYQ